MKYAHWYRKLFIPVKNTQKMDFFDLTPEMVERDPEMDCHLDLYINTNFMAILLFNHVDIQNINRKKFNSVMKQLFWEFLKKIEKIIKKKTLWQRIQEIFFKKETENISLNVSNITKKILNRYTRKSKIWYRLTSDTTEMDRTSSERLAVMIEVMNIRDYLGILDIQYE